MRFKILNNLINMCKSSDDKRDLGYLDGSITPTGRKITILRLKR